MDAFLNFYHAIPPITFTVIGIIERIACILMINFSSKYRSGYPRKGWYVFALFFPTIAGVAFFIKRKEMGAPDMKVCPICKSKYPKDFTYCHKCNVELGEYSEKKKKTQKIFAVFFAVLFFASCIVSIGADVISLANNIFSTEDEDDYLYEPGIEVDGVYYDRDGNGYRSFYEVPLYTKDGKKFVYSNATERYESKDASISLYDCVVDKDGYLSEVAVSELEYVDQTLTGDDFYLDADGNKYYPAELIGWNEKGEFLLRSRLDGLDYEVLAEITDEQ